MDWRGSIEGALARGWESFREAVLAPQAAAPSDEKVASLASQAAPVIWLIGKVQSGKSSIVRALTEASAAEVGLGYKPCTRTAAIFDFPAEAPVIRFLDTRGLGEKGYDPAEDIAFHEAQSHLVIAVVKALDPQQDSVLDALKAARKRHPEWPVIVAQTSLHEAYAPGEGHKRPYPFGDPGAEAALPQALTRSLSSSARFSPPCPAAEQSSSFQSILRRRATVTSPPPMACTRCWPRLRRRRPRVSLPRSRTQARKARINWQRRPTRTSSDMRPPPQPPTLYRWQAPSPSLPCSRKCSTAWRSFTASSGIGSRSASSRRASEPAQCRVSLPAFGLRELAKLIPVYGQTAGAAAAAATSFATTFAIGKAACYFLSQHRLGTSDAQGVAKAYSAALSEAFRIRKAAGGAAA